MLDPDEGLADDRTIRTGAGVDRIREPFGSLLADVVDEVGSLVADASVYVFGSVATGQAVVPRSDVDLLAIGLRSDEANAIGDSLSTRYAAVCRSVDIGAAQPADFEGDRDEAYGNRVFLRHYCVHLAGPDLDRSSECFSGDARAARGFNGDIGLHRDRWTAQLGDLEPAVLGRRIARKALLAAAGLVSVHDATWTTDRGTASHRLGEIAPTLADDLAELLAWSGGEVQPRHDDVRRLLDGAVDAIVSRFAAEIGLWPD